MIEPSTRTRLDDAGLLEAVRELAATDSDLAGIVERHGPPPLWGREPGFESLVRIILEQQISLASAEAARLRLVGATGAIEPEAIAAAAAAMVPIGVTAGSAVSDEALRGAGAGVVVGSLVELADSLTKR